MTNPDDDNQTAEQSDAAAPQGSAQTTVRADPGAASHVAQDAIAPEHATPTPLPPEHGGQAGLEPTRYGDWEKKGRCTDF